MRGKPLTSVIVMRRCKNSLMQYFKVLSSFQSRMLSTFPDTTLVTSMDDCSHLAHAEGRHLQIFPVEPVSEISANKNNINRLILWYYKHNRVSSALFLHSSLALLCIFFVDDNLLFFFSLNTESLR